MTTFVTQTAALNRISPSPSAVSNTRVKTASGKPDFPDGDGIAGVVSIDRHLVSRAQQGDVNAFEQLYTRTAPRVFALCLRMTGDRGSAQELAHDAFVRAWETLGSFRGDSTFTSWMHRLTVNVVLQDSRTTRRREARVRLSDDDDVPADAPCAPGMDTETRIVLEDALARLTDDARRVVVLHDIEGYKHDEIASLLGVAPGTIRARLHHARKQLKEWILR